MSDFALNPFETERCASCGQLAEAPRRIPVDFGPAADGSPVILRIPHCLECDQKRMDEIKKLWEGGE